MHLLLSYAEVESALMATGLRQREARAHLTLGSEWLKPHPHQLHTQRRWLRPAVEAYCRALEKQMLDSAGV